jgi:V/A-type H+-transporting ATPase subunit E
MAEQLQGLLEKIHEEGLKKADQAKDQILAEAKKQAEDIVAKAKSEADGIRKNAETDAAALEKRAKTAISQASRDIILKLREGLQDRIESIIRDTAAETMTPKFMGELIAKMAVEFQKQDSNAEPALELLVSEKDLEEMKKLIHGSLAASFKTEPEIFPGSDIGSGLKIGFKGSDVFYDFSDDAVADMICAYIGPRLAAVIKNEKAE